MLLNTGTKPVQSKNGLLTTLGYKIGNQPAVYCLEGSIAITGALVQWLRDNLRMFDFSKHVEDYAQCRDDNGGIYFVPAFSGLFAPYWKSDARGAIVGLTRYVNKGHIARAALEATAYPDPRSAGCDERRLRRDLTALKVDGGMVFNDTADAVPGRHPGRARDSPGGGRDHGAGRGLCGRSGRRLLEGRGRPARQLGQGQGVGSQDGCEHARRACIRVGRRP